jgi:hypothetical protein
MHLDRRRFLQSAGLAGAALVVPRAAASAKVPDSAPRTGFETRGGASWTTHDEELAFLRAVARGSKRVSVDVIGKTEQGRPLHLVSIGAPAPRGTGRPTTMFVGSQHGNEPAGRETTLQLLRDLAFTTDPTLVRQLSEQSVLVVPSANPDGREANTRENSLGVDVNRDHLALTQNESQAIAAVLRDCGPDVVLDLHEYGPSVPVLYDDEVLYLWPRNLNVDPAVRDLSRTLAEEYIGKGARAAGYTADEYGLLKAGPQEVTRPPATRTRASAATPWACATTSGSSWSPRSRPTPATAPPRWAPRRCRPAASRARPRSLATRCASCASRGRSRATWRSRRRCARRRRAAAATPRSTSAAPTTAPPPPPRPSSRRRRRT